MESLKAEGVKDVFGIPGGANLPTYDAMVDAEFRHVQVRHEQGGGHAAEGYAQASGRVGVAFATSGPGATNLVTAIADTMLDSVPTVFITGQVRTELIGTDGFQEADILGATLPFVKHSFAVTDPRQIPEYVHKAFHVASTGRPGPVLLDIPQDLSRAEIDYAPRGEPVELAYSLYWKTAFAQVVFVTVPGLRRIIACCAAPGTRLCVILPASLHPSVI